MNRNPDTTPRWSTSSFGSPPEISSAELAALGDHLSRCRGQRGGLLAAMRRAGEALNDFAASRVITTSAVIAMLVVVVSLLA